MRLRRPILFIMSQMHMLEYVKYAATTSSGNGMSLPSGELDKHFRTHLKMEKMTIYGKGGMIKGGNMIPLISVEKNRYGEVSWGERWVLRLSFGRSRSFVATEHAGWTSDHILWPLATFVGFKTCSTSLENLLSFLYEAQYPCEAGARLLKVLGYNDVAVLDWASS
ncbi:hypothetical protein Tco_0221965 [Tanacetum coccineum]